MHRSRLLNLWKRRKKTGGENQDMGAKLVKRVQQLLGRLRLTNNANVFLHRQYPGYSGAKDCLMVSDDDVNHSGTWRGSGFFWLEPEFNFGEGLSTPLRNQD